ncbi:MAG: hypothetical protein P4L30_12800 [Candidatus Limnocylindrales bacterium]|jgi:hypothetical protein|nr:hypothetical protein [Candidatus Limnocylindrales bacterium]
MSQKYTGQAYERRTPREVFVIELDRVGHSGSWRWPTGSKWGGLFVLPASCSARPRHLIREWTTTQADWMLFDTATLTRCRLNVRTGIANGVFITRAVVGSHEPCRYASS